MSPALEQLWPWLPDLAVATLILYLWLSGRLRTEREMKEALAAETERADKGEARAESAEGKLENVLREDIRMAREREQTTQMILQATAAGRSQGQPHGQSSGEPRGAGGG